MMNLSQEALDEAAIFFRNVLSRPGLVAAQKELARFPMLSREIERSSEPLSMRPPDYVPPAFGYKQLDARRWAVRRAGEDWREFPCRGPGALLLGRLLTLRGGSMPGSHGNAKAVREIIGRMRGDDGIAHCPELGRRLGVSCRDGLLRLHGSVSDVEVELLAGAVPAAFP